jgi:hypothetical protein
LEVPLEVTVIVKRREGKENSRKSGKNKTTNHTDIKYKQDLTGH